MFFVSAFSSNVLYAGGTKNNLNKKLFIGFGSEQGELQQLEYPL